MAPRAVPSNGIPSLTQSRDVSLHRLVFAVQERSDAVLLDELKEWRKQEARTQGVPAYVILHDSSLTAIATSRPASLTALADIAGIGAKKLERYGAALIELVRNNGAD